VRSAPSELGNNRREALDRIVGNRDVVGSKPLAPSLKFVADGLDTAEQAVRVTPHFVDIHPKSARHSLCHGVGAFADKCEVRADLEFEIAKSFARCLSNPSDLLLGLLFG
jgi:hypothetical protein